MKSQGLKSISNQDIAKILQEMAAYYEMQNIEFKPRAYEKAAMGIADLDEDIGERYKAEGFKGLTRIPGVGQGIAEHIEELLRSGKLKKYEALKKKIPVNLSDLMSIEGIGPKTVKVLYQKLKIRSLDDLKHAAQKHEISSLPGFGQKSEEKILAGLGFRSKDAGRFVLGFIEPQVERLVTKLKESKLFERLEVAGSYRRRQETVGDIDILAISKTSKKAMEFFVRLPEASRVLEHGPTKSEIVLQKGPQVDLRIVPMESWGAALQYFTGDKSHNIKMRKIAIDKGLKLSEYGLTSSSSPPYKGGEKKRGYKIETEEQVYKALGMDYIPPELRTDTGEIEAAQKHNLPKLINYGEVKGDLQVQTNWTDGSNSIEDMAKAAAAAKLSYIAITDHTKSLAMTGGLDEKKLLRQMVLIDKLNKKFKNSSQPPLWKRGGVPSLLQREGKGEFKILKGAEVNILKDGSLDIANEVLAKLDIVGVSIHSHFKMSREDMTKRITRALSNPNVDIFFHPTTRIINRRGPIDFDFPEILKAAKKYKVALEINSYPDRMDIHDTMIRQAVEARVKLVINTDAHHTSHFRYLHLGEAQARRGWASKNDILNTKPAEELLKSLKK